MANIKFYRQTDGLWLYVDQDGNEQVHPSGSCRFFSNGNYISVKINTEISYFIYGKDVTKIEKSATPNDFYASVSEFLTTNKLLFGAGSSFITDENGQNINVQHPFMVDGDSIYIKDIDWENSDFTGWTGNPENLFKSPFSESIVNNSIDSPKTFTIAFKRTLYTSQVGLGENNGGDFSNTKITALGSSGFVRGILDDSNKNEKKTSWLVKVGVEAINSFKFEFFTNDPVSLSNLTIPKSNLVEIGNRVTDAIPISLDSVYRVDLDLNLCSSAGFEGGNISDLISFQRLTLVNTSTDNPKSLFVRLARPIQTNVLGISTKDGNFSNVRMTIGFGDIPGTTVIIYDGSVDNTKRNILIPSIPPITFSSLLIEFFTTDTISINAIGISKSIQTISRIQAQKPDGTLGNTQLTDSGNFKVSDAESGMAIAKGDVQGTTFIHKFGKAPDFDTIDGYVTMWDGANDADIALMQYQYSTTAIIDSISSTDNSDTQNIDVLGLDENFNQVSQVITLTGQTRAALTTNLIRVFRLKNIGVTDNAGYIYCYENTALTLGRPIDINKIRAAILPGNNQTLMTVYTVPTGKTGYLRDLFASISGAIKTSIHNMRLVIRPFGQVFQIKYDASIIAVGSSNLEKKYEEPEIIPEKADIELRVNTDSNSASVSGGFDIVLVDNVL